MKLLSGKRILLGVSGGIAAYKSAELVRQLRTCGARVRVVMTRAACEFITPLTLKALSGEPVWSEWSDEDVAMGHIELARWADRILIAPATADMLARLAQGHADDLLAAICLASGTPLLVAPAMNQAMWRHPATLANVETLRQRDVRVLGPADGEQACGDVGPGRMLDPAELVERLSQDFAAAKLAGVKVVITAGPTREPLDPVRFLSNRSSGKMGYAVARAAAEAGAYVVLVTGPVSLEAPPGVHCLHVETAQQMNDAVMGQMDGCKVFIAAAAVADYRPATVSEQKIKKKETGSRVELEPTEDILSRVSSMKKRPFCVGFAAETENVAASAQKKRLSKGVELIAANRVGSGIGFDSDENQLLLIWEGGSLELQKDSKTRLARHLVDQIVILYAKTSTNTSTKMEPHAKHSA